MDSWHVQDVNLAHNHANVIFKSFEFVAVTFLECKENLSSYEYSNLQIPPI